MAFERDYITTFVICTGDSDLTPLVHKLRELNKRVIGVGVKESTSALLPPACDEFLFYDSLEGVDVRAAAEPAPPPPVVEQDDVEAKDVDQLAISSRRPWPVSNARPAVRSWRRR